MFFNKKDNIENSKEIVENVSPSGGDIETSQNITKQRYQSILAKRVFKETEEALEVAELLLTSVQEINVEMEKHEKHIQKTVDVSAEVGAFSEEVHANVEETMKVIDETLNKAHIGQKSVGDVINSIRTIQLTVENTNTIMNELAEKSSKIKTIVDTIKGIAKTTHLLSLNANIEAARAGEAGRGFSVVAGEVKKLAENSSKSADEIDKIINEITKVTKETQHIIMQGVDKVVESTSIAETASRAIDDMMNSVEKTKTISTEIGLVVKEQTDKNQYMISVIDDMVDVAEKVRAVNENISVNADRQKAALSTLQNTIVNLNLLSKTEFNEELINKTTFTMSSSMPKSFDPSMATDISASNVVTPINLGLVQFGLGSEVVGAIARNWHLESDNVTWSFNLRKDIKFHNGRTLTSGDVKYSFERLLGRELDSPNRWFLSIIKGAEEYFNGNNKEVSGIIQSGEYGIKLVLQYPYSSFVNNLAHCCCTILPKEEIHNINNNPIGAGPYRVREIDRKSNIIHYEKFKDYSLGEALVDSIAIKCGLKEPTEEFLNGDLDYIAVDGANIKQIKQSNYRIENTECIGIRFVAFNFRSNNPLIKNKLVRQAINYCLDKEKIISEGLGGFENLAKGVFPSSILNNNREINYTRNVIKAKELMKKSGIASGSLTIQIIENEKGTGLHYKVLEVLTDSLKELGITIKVIKTTSAKYYDAENLGNSDLFIYGWLGDSGTADNFIEPLIDIDNPSNRSRYSNPELMELLTESKKTKNPYKYKEILCKLENKILEDSPWVFLSNICVSYAYKSNLKGLRVHPLNIIKFADLWKE